MTVTQPEPGECFDGFTHDGAVNMDCAVRCVCPSCNGSGCVLPGDCVTQGDGMRSLDTTQPARTFVVEDAFPDDNEIQINGHRVPAQSYKKAET